MDQRGSRARRGGRPVARAARGAAVAPFPHAGRCAGSAATRRSKWCWSTPRPGSGPPRRRCSRRRTSTAAAPSKSAGARRPRCRSPSRASRARTWPTRNAASAARGAAGRAARAGARGADARAVAGTAPAGRRADPGAAAERARPGRPRARRDAPAGADRPADPGVPEAPAQEVHRRERRRVPLRAVRGGLARQGRAHRHAQLPGRGARQALRQPAADRHAAPRRQRGIGRSRPLLGPQGARRRGVQDRAHGDALRRVSRPTSGATPICWSITRTWFFGKGDKIWTE